MLLCSEAEEVFSDKPNNGQLSLRRWAASAVSLTFSASRRTTASVSSAGWNCAKTTGLLAVPVCRLPLGLGRETMRWRSPARAPTRVTRQLGGEPSFRGSA